MKAKILPFILLLFIVGITWFVMKEIRGCNNTLGHFAGNRKPDIDIALLTNVSGYYTKKYMISLDPKYFNHGPKNAEAEVYFENFIPITDSTLGYKYLLEFEDLTDTAYIKYGGLSLASIYDFNKKQWITNNDSLKQNAFEMFQTFFTENVLRNVVRKYKDSIPIELLFKDKPDSIILRKLY